jgi:hypothetical protein
VIDLVTLQMMLRSFVIRWTTVIVPVRCRPPAQCTYTG